jgi:hypothetical protein
MTEEDRMDLGVERNGRGLDLAFMGQTGPRCSWKGDDLVLIGRVIGGVHRSARSTSPWLMRLDHLAAAFDGTPIGDRDVVLQIAVDAKAIGADEAADGFADCVRFPVLTPAEIERARPRLSWRAGRQPRVAYEMKRIWREEDHPRHPAGSPNSAGGEFALKPASARVSARSPRREAEPRIERLRRALAARSDLSARERRIYGQIAEEEGVDRKDPVSTAFAGILKETLDDAKTRHPSLSQFATPSALSDSAIVTVYKDYFDHVMRTVGGSGAINEIGSDCAAAAYMDTLFRHGRGLGTTLIQRAVLQTWSLYAPAEPLRMTADGRHGPETFDVFKVLVDAGYGPQLTRRLAELRTHRAPSGRRRFARFVCAG